jgi:hypothetical protein
MVHLLADLGFNDVWHLSIDGSTLNDNPNTFTPNINKLIADGIALTAYHTYVRSVAMHGSWSLHLTGGMLTIAQVLARY